MKELRICLTVLTGWEVDDDITDWEIKSLINESIEEVGLEVNDVEWELVDVQE